ncbi:MAG: hypothetical protein EOO06_12405 [Chitinophagaceae bacterium]|nr:MAG: hypothetical protein EOO06_12405 [Chitinophagaceae bacterium]
MSFEWLKSLIVTTDLLNQSDLTRIEKTCLEAVLIDRLNNKEIAEDLEVTPERIRQINERAIFKLSTFLRRSPKVCMRWQILSRKTMRSKNV